MKYKIKQIKDIRNCGYAFMHYNWCKDQINLDDYEVVYEGELECSEISEALEELFEIFNIRHPEDFKGRSLSVSDIVEVDGENYYCDAAGWKKLK